MNLRGIMINDFKSFLDIFFTKTPKSKLKEILAGVSVNIGFFKVGLDDEALLKQNPFRVMEGQLTKAKKKGLQPVLIIDEIHNLKNIYLNGERHLLDELFNLFVRLTKEIHVAHVILLTSDSYFIEDIYGNAKLKKTTEYFHIGHLSEEDVQTWLFKEGMKKKDIQLVWKTLGGNAWEIRQVLSKYNDGENIKAACEYFVNDEYSKLFDYIPKALSEEEEALMQKVHRNIVEKGFAYMGDYNRDIYRLIPRMVERDFWFYHTHTQQITANSESIRWAMKRMLDN